MFSYLQKTTVRDINRFQIHQSSRHIMSCALCLNLMYAYHLKIMLNMS